MYRPPRPLWRRILRAVLSVVLLVAILFVGYFAYLLIDYHRIPDHVALDVTDKNSALVRTGEEYTLLSFNIGFAAYTPDFGFFMDGGTESRAASESSVRENMADILSYLRSENADFLMLQEVDLSATRTYGVDEKEILTSGLSSYSSVFALNYDSSYLFYPFTRPHGKSKAGLLTLSRYHLASSERRSLPVEQSLMKFFDLDRAYTVSRLPTENGKELVLYTFHLSAYTSDGTVATEQLEMLLSDMQSEYEKGNYTIAGGDFNKDLLGNSAAVFGVSGEGQTWAQPIPPEAFDGVDIRLVAPFDPDLPVPSCRNADGPYHPAQFVLTVDGFLLSPNVTSVKSDVVAQDFAYSDHNPVYLRFCLN